MNIKLFLTLGLLGILSTPVPGTADRPIKPSNKPWATAEQELAEKGLATDTPSVVKVALSSPDPSVRGVAIELLGLRGEVSAKGTLRKILLNDESLLVRETAALALARLQEPGALEELKAFLMNSEAPVRQLFLATRLIELGDLSGSPYISKAATAEDEYLRFLSVESLIILVTLDKSIPELDPGTLLMRLMSDRSAKVRQEVVFQLSVALFKGFSLQQYLEKIQWIAKHDHDAEVREQAELLLTSWKEFGKPRSER